MREQLSSHAEVLAGDGFVLLTQLLDLLLHLLHILLLCGEFLLDHGVHRLRHAAIHHAL